MPPRRQRPEGPLPRPISATLNLHPLLPAKLRPTRPSKPASKRTTLTATPLHKDLIWAIPNFLTPSECAAWIAHATSAGFAQTRLPASRDTAFRDNGRVELWSDAVAARLWDRLRPLVPLGVCDGEAVGCYAKIRLYRYEVGQRFGKHVDESADVGDGEYTGVTVLVYLNGGEMKGGETVFYEGRRDERVALSFQPAEGSLLLHGHGARCLTHEARAVRQGTKYVLRTDIVYKGR